MSETKIKAQTNMYLLMEIVNALSPESLNSTDNTAQTKILRVIRDGAAEAIKHIESLEENSHG